MHILVLNWRSPLSYSAGGAEVHFYEIFSRIAKKGNVVHLVASCDDSTKPKKVLVGNMQVSHVTSKETLYPIFAFFAWRKISSRYYDVIVEDVSKIPTIWPLLFAKLFSKPFVIMVHHVHGKTLFKELSYPFNLLLYFLELFGLRFYSLFSPYVITVSESSKSELSFLGFNEKKISVVYNGLSFSSKIDSLSEKKAPFPFIAYFGRVKKYKRLEHLVLAAKDVSLRLPNVKIVIAGKGDARVYQNLAVLARQIGLGNVVEFCGEVSEKKKIDILREAWVYAIPSMKEGFGISVIEAQVFGVPAVAYDVPGLRDSVQHLVSGILVRDGDIQAFADALILVCEDGTLREKLARGAIENASKYDWGKSSDEFLCLLNKIVESRNEN